MIYLTEGNIPLNAAHDDDIVQEDNSTYQLTFKFPTNDILWQRLREEKFLTADDLHGEQDFVIFEVEKKHGYIQVYANQVMTMLNHYVVNPMSLDRVTGSTALSQFAGSITRSNPFSFFSDIDDRHTFNIDSKTAMEALTKDKHSIVGLWGGDLVRHGYQVRLLKNGGSENESLFMYKKNLSSYEHKTSTKSLRTRITFITTIRGEGENPVDKHYKVVVDSPLINKYSQIYEDVVEVNDQDVKDEASLREYGKQYFRTTLCDMLEDSIEIDVIGQSDVPVQMFDVVGVYHEYYDLDVRKKITKYNYSPMAKKLKSIGFGEFKSGLASAIGNVVSDAIKEETQIFETRLNKEIENADLAFDRKVKDIKDEFTDGIELIKAKTEENKRSLSEEINRRFQDFNPAGFEEVKRRAEEALRSAGASTLLAQEAKRIGLDSVAKLEEFKRQSTSDQTALSGDLDVLKHTVASEVNQASEYRRTTTEALSRMTGQMDGFATKSEVRQDVTGLTETFAKLKTDTNNLISGAKNEITLAKTEFKITADGLSAKMAAVESYVGQDGQRQEALRKYTRDESARQATAVRELVTRDYVGKASHQEDVRAIERKFEAITNPQNGSIATQIATYRNAVDGRLTEITSMISGKANQADFQRVQETSKLYERIIGSNENDISNKVARMALTNQLFQVEVSKYALQGGPNLVKNSGNPKDTQNWGYWEIGQNPAIRVGTHDFFFKNKRNLFYVNNKTRETVPTSTIRFPLKRNTSYTVSLTAFNTWNMKGATIYFLGRKSGENQSFSKVITLVENVKFSSDEAVRKNYIFNSEECDEGFIRIDNNGTNDNQEAILLFGDVDVYEGIVTRPWQPSPEDNNEAVRTVQSQLAGSYAIQNLNSAGDLINGINLAADGTTRFVSKLTHISGDTLIDNAVIKSAMIDKLKTANFEAGSVTTNILGAEAVTAEKVKFDTAFIQRLVSQQAFINELFAKQATITKIQSIDFTGNHIKGGRISSLNGKATFDLQSGWIDMNQPGVGIRNQFAGRPIQYLVFGQGSLHGKDGSYTALMSNSNNKVAMDDGAAGIQIWNTNDNTSAVNIYGDMIDFMYNASDPRSIHFDTIKNEISNLETIWIKGKSLEIILNDIFWNFRVLFDGGANLPYGVYKYWNGNK